MSLLSRLRRPQTTVRWRLTLLYGGLFLACGAALLAITYALVAHASTSPGQSAISFIGGHPRVTHVRVPPASVPPAIQQALRSKPGQAAVRLVVANQRVADLNQLEIESGIALAIMAIISALLGWLVAGRVLRPLRTITATAQEISEANLHRRLALDGPRDELRRLADTIDALLARLEGAFDAQRRFVANASHELRTPLTATRAMLEMVLSDPDANVATFRETCRQVLSENEYQEELIDALLTLAHGQRGLERRERVDLTEVTNTVLAASELDAAASGVTLERSLTPAAVTGDQRLIERLVSNLIQNAIRHNFRGGRVDVSVRAEGLTATLQVTNTGPIVPAEEIHRLMQPFQRLARPRTGQGAGLGLGLSIVAAVADAHGARLKIRREVAGGLNVVVQFPLQLVLEDLSEGVAGEGVHELHLAGALERSKALGGKLE